jgi:hypothetical protein
MTANGQKENGGCHEDGDNTTTTHAAADADHILGAAVAVVAVFPRGLQYAMMESTVYKYCIPG